MLLTTMSLFDPHPRVASFPPRFTRKASRLWIAVVSVDGCDARMMSRLRTTFAEERCTKEMGFEEVVCHALFAARGDEAGDEAVVRLDRGHDGGGCDDEEGEEE